MRKLFGKPNDNLEDNNQDNKKKKNKQRLYFAFQAIFWFCNLSFLLVSCLGILPAILGWKDGLETFYSVLIALTVASTASMGMGLWRLLRPEAQPQAIPRSLFFQEIVWICNLVFFLAIAVTKLPIVGSSISKELLLGGGTLIAGAAIAILLVWRVIFASFKTTTRYEASYPQQSGHEDSDELGGQRERSPYKVNLASYSYAKLAAALSIFFWLCNLALWRTVPPKIDISWWSDRQFLITIICWIAIGTVSTGLGWHLRQQPIKLMRLLYGIEAPLFFFFLLSLFLALEINSASLSILLNNPASALILGTVLLSILAFSIELFHGSVEKNRALAWGQLLAHSLVPGVGVYLGLILLFYAIPTAIAIIPAFFSFVWVFGFLYTLASQPWWTSLGAILFSFSALLFPLMPWLLAQFYIKSGYRVFSAFAQQYGRSRTWVGSLAAVTAWMVLYLSLTQPQLEAFELLATPPQTESAKQELIAKSERIRDGLVNAYLHPYRYVGTWENNTHIRDIYGVFVGYQFLQHSYNSLMSPFLYNGSDRDIELAEKLYAEFFDTPLQKAERTRIQRALAAAGELDDAKAGVLNIDQKKVWLREQEVALEPHGDWAEVELYEVYENKTTDVEEVLYYFSLPESAVITGLWLGDSADRDRRFTFRISPRGAAQQVYNSQVRRVRPIDPALLEQVGPRQYRLKAFPVPPRLSDREREEGSERPSEMHLWLTYKVMRQEKGWPLPELGEKRNIFWNRDTKRAYNGEALKFPEDNWLPAFLPATEKYQPALHQINLSGGYRISAKPLATDYALPRGKRFAVVLDTSRSMKEQSQAVNESLRWLREVFAPKNNVDIYISAAKGSQPQRIDDISQLDPSQIIFYGTVQFQDMLRQFAQLQGNSTYDGILLLTDEGSYELAANRKDLPEKSAPLWLVHLGKMPNAYDDATLQVIQDSDGGIARNIPEALQRLAAKADLDNLDEDAISVIDGYAWFAEKTTGQNIASVGFEQLAARQLIDKLAREKDLQQLAEMDAIHALAKTYNIVSPYSSAIVLVNDEQREALKRAEAQKDRFGREVEDGLELKQQSGLRASTPEPGAIVGLAAIAFILANRKRKKFKF
ncbi:MAG: TIGR02921 family PEP-CTERM protein [Oscillatoria sp. SIO1A7]|nr:TIGR02921 family PEP-CTERM protein [Oscillatoria sp. SIO1A7]